MCNSLLKPLIASIRKQDMSGFNLIYQEFKRLISLYADRIGDDDAAQELTVFFIELLYSIELDIFKADDSDGLKRYIAVSIRNKYIALSKERQLLDRMTNELYDNLAFFYQDADEGLILEEALKMLTPQQRAIIVYKYIYCYSDAEICMLLGVSRQAVNKMKNRALMLLRQIYEP